MSRPEGAFSNALKEASAFFMKEGKVHTTLYRLTHRLNEAGIPYVILGGMAMNAHGYERVTTDVDVLTTREGLDRIHEVLVGRGYLPKFPGSRKTLRDTTTDVSIDFITAGEYPGDGKPKPVQFPDPSSVAIEHDGYRVIDLLHLLELKLASGLSNALRLKDLADAQQLIVVLKPPRELGEQLDASVRDEYYRLWEIAQTPDPFQEEPPQS
jgi:hypothetical protein